MKGAQPEVSEVKRRIQLSLTLKQKFMRVKKYCDMTLEAGR